MIFEASYVRRNMYVPTLPYFIPTDTSYQPHFVSDRAKNEIAEWERFFTELNTESLPNLHEIWVENCEWPTTE